MPITLLSAWTHCGIGNAPELLSGSSPSSKLTCVCALQSKPWCPPRAALSQQEAGLPDGPSVQEELKKNKKPLQLVKRSGAHVLSRPRPQVAHVP